MHMYVIPCSVTIKSIANGLFLADTAAYTVRTNIGTSTQGSKELGRAVYRWSASPAPASRLTSCCTFHLKNSKPPTIIPIILRTTYNVQTRVHNYPTTKRVDSLAETGKPRGSGAESLPGSRCLRYIRGFVRTPWLQVAPFLPLFERFPRAYDVHRNERPSQGLGRSDANAQTTERAGGSLLCNCGGGGRDGGGECPLCHVILAVNLSSQCAQCVCHR
ncbi:hypothetical protein SODALDRAFT_52040 [Sodiomyces alkalinus F11]|uniref:Uncharacterized protein n=1 Tax=Sodiomyces alkalinus (strain CBS 110278 / VKM F-3762 / F11) TaxID=1314773 RepID=A0A3N2PMR8_SODAK|nr:hypothetical protein SODALDRAFT_52040 [Sodiomyces alkalinus F11]ROT35821.1 hypothetical protein SODALDRAFT_52040 [Sodiomyces alkalinus F11]